MHMYRNHGLFITNNLIKATNNKAAFCPLLELIFSFFHFVWLQTTECTAPFIPVTFHRKNVEFCRCA